MFRSGTYDLRGFAKMPSECPACGQDFRIEPGFYMGASYLHYLLCVIVIVGCLGVYFAFFSRASEWLFIAAALGANLLVLPPSFRFSRALMLHLFAGIRYDPRVLSQQDIYYVDEAGNLQVDEEGE